MHRNEHTHKHTDTLKHLTTNPLCTILADAPIELMESVFKGGGIDIKNCLKPYKELNLKIK